MKTDTEFLSTFIGAVRLEVQDKMEDALEFNPDVEELERFVEMTLETLGKSLTRSLPDSHFQSLAEGYRYPE
jgi:hypothetical protein